MAAGSTQISDARRVDGSVDVERLARILHANPDDLTDSAGLSQVSGAGGQVPREADSRLSELLEILELIEPWTGTPRAAFTWYQSQRLPSFGDLTAQDLVRKGRISDLKSHLSRVHDGGYT
jgi:hypothetical protein